MVRALEAAFRAASQWLDGLAERQVAAAADLAELKQGPGASPEENDTFTDETIARINATGEAFFSGVRWRGRRAMRVSVVNWRTNDEDVRRAVAAAAKVLGRG